MPMDKHQFGSSRAAEVLVDVLAEHNNPCLSRKVGKFLSKTNTYLYGIVCPLVLANMDYNNFHYIMVLFKRDYYQKIDEMKWSSTVKEFVKCVLNSYFTNHDKFFRIALNLK